MTEKQKIKLELEKERIRGMREFENGLVREALGSDLFVVAGIDEAGRGPMFGPLVVGAVYIEDDSALREIGVKDSKKLTPSARDRMFDQIRGGARLVSRSCRTCPDR